MVQRAFLPAMRATQNNLSGLTKLAPNFFGFAGNKRIAPPDVLASPCAGIVPLVADDGDDYEMDEDFIRIMVGSGDRVAGFAIGVAVLTLAGALWMFL